MQNSVRAAVGPVVGRPARCTVNSTNAAVACRTATAVRCRGRGCAVRVGALRYGAGNGGGSLVAGG